MRSLLFIAVVLSIGCKSRSPSQIQEAPPMPAVSPMEAIPDPFFPDRKLSPEALAGIRVDLFAKYCTSCHTGGLTGEMRGIVHGDAETRALAIAGKAILITRVLSWEETIKANGITMPEVGSSERALLEDNPKDREAMLTSIQSIVAAADPREVSEVRNGIRRGVQSYGAFNQGDRDMAVSVCKREGGYTKNNLKDYCNGTLETLYDEQSCDLDKNCLKASGFWTCQGRLAWLCRPE